MPEDQAPDFNKLLDTKASEFKAPEAVPQGHYLTLIETREYIKSSEKKTPGVRLMHQLLRAERDVDQEGLKKALKGKELSGKSIRNDLWITANASYRITELGVTVGLPTDQLTLKEIIEQFPNKKCIVFLSRTPSNREGDDRWFNNIENTLPAKTEISA